MLFPLVAVRKQAEAHSIGTAFSRTVSLLPISHGRRAHWPKPTALLNFDVVGSGGLQCGIQRLSLYQLLAGLTTRLSSGLTLLARYAPAGAGSLAGGY